jgi:hypothetical protein
MTCAHASGVLTVILVATGCTRSSELLPPAQDRLDAEANADTADVDASTFDPAPLPFCPTTIDVYGGINMALVGCGGPSQGPSPIEGGFGGPRGPDAGAREYANTMAGRLQARLVADPDLVPVFGANWQVRSCAAPIETLPTLVAPLAEDSCGEDEPAQMGTLTNICSTQPAPLLLLSAGALDDRCHGGGPDSSAADDAATFADHFAQRLDTLLGNRNPQMAIVGPQTEWQAQQSSIGGGQIGPTGGGPTGRPSCTWQRPEWAELGIETWRTAHPERSDVVLVDDLHEEFKRHSACCQSLGVTCDTSWFSSSGPTQEAVNCDGAQALVDFWYDQLKTQLLARRFQCP